MYHCIDRRCCKNLVRKGRKQICDQYCFVRQHRIRGKSHFYAFANTIDDRYIRNFTSGSAGCWNDNKWMYLFQGVHIIVQIIYGIVRAGNCDHFRNINYCATADCNDPIIFFVSKGIENCVDISVGRFPLAVFFTK